MIRKPLAIVATVLRIATALAVIVALLVPHISNAPRHELAMAMAQADGTMTDHSRPGMAHGTFGGIACAVVCFGAPGTESPVMPTRVLRMTLARYAAFVAEPYTAFAPDPALRPPDAVRSV